MADGLCLGRSLEAYVASHGFWRPKLSQPLLPPEPLHLPAAMHAATHQGAIPGIIWMFWAQQVGLGAFRRACIHSWICKNPGWRVMLLSRENCFSFIDPEELPKHWRRMPLAALSDAVRLALLRRHGGVYVDVSVVCNLALEDWLPNKPWPLVAFFYENCGRVGRINEGEYVENWFLACARGSELIRRWHAAFMQFWHDRASADEAGGVWASEMFRDIDLSLMAHQQANYLSMHCCFKWLLDTDPAARQLSRESLLLSAQAAIGWIRELAGVHEDWCKSNVVGRHAARWLYRDDLEWVEQLLRRAPMLKFVGAHASIFDRQPVHHLLRPKTCMELLIKHALQARQSHLEEAA